jgi:GNAT superfamily N-acetyltransferase
MQIDYLAHHLSFLPELARWHFVEWSHLRPGDTVQARTERLRKVCGTGGVPCVFVAFEARALLGSAGLVPHDLPERPQWEPWLAGVYVKPDERRRGIGTALVSRVEAKARGLGVRQLYLYTARAEDFYARRGWQVIERLERVGEQQVVMALELLRAGSSAGTPAGASAGEPR